MNRRELLYRAGGSAIGSAAGVAGVMVVAKAISCTAEAACPGITVDRPVAPMDRLSAAIDELKAALVAIDPSIADWHVTNLEHVKAPGDGEPDGMCRFLFGALSKDVPRDAL